MKGKNKRDEKSTLSIIEGARSQTRRQIILDMNPEHARIYYALKSYGEHYVDSLYRFAAFMLYECEQAAKKLEEEHPYTPHTKIGNVVYVFTEAPSEGPQ